MRSNVKKNLRFPGIPVILGTAEMGSAIPLRDSVAVLDAYASLGGRVLDTANNYAFWHPGATGGESETVLGNWLDQHYGHHQDRLPAGADGRRLG
jgi:aryl-alcohol dehydrogenase-like predicted oxidoreductase